MRWMRPAQAAVAEGPHQAGGGDVARGSVATGASSGAEVGEAVGERLGHALGEEVGHALAVGPWRRGRSRGRRASAMPNGASSARPVTASGRSAASSAAIIPPTEAPDRPGSGGAPVASIASQNVVSQSR